MDDEILKILLKRAMGYTYEEIQEEYGVREDGNVVLTKRKINEKYCPPDSAAMKAYLELCGEKSIENYSDEELENERKRLLEELEIKNCQPKG